MNKELLFVTDIVDGSEFRNLTKSRYFLYTIFIFSSFFYFLQVLYKDIEISLLERILIEIPTFTFYMAILILAIFYLNYISYKRKSKGILEITKRGVNFSYPDKTYEIPFSELKFLKITRGSTFHYNYQEKNAIVKVNNFIQFENEGEKHKIEFEIDSERKNEMFEEMIERLTDKQIEFKYLSI